MYAQQPISKIATIPLANLKTVQVCAGSQIIFSSVSDSVISGAILSWNFGTGAQPSSASGNGPFIVTYSSPNTIAKVTLEIDNNNGASVSLDTLLVQVNANPVSNLVLANNATGYSTSLNNGLKIFKRCNASDTSIFNFTSNFDSTITQKLIWGSSDTSTNFNMLGNGISHKYALGQFSLTHHIQLSNGCSMSQQYIVFNGSAPFVTIGGAGQNTCLPFPFPISLISNKVPIDYSISFSDGTPAVTFSTNSDTTISHVFNKSSCGVDFVFAPGIPPIPNAYSGTIVAQNFCSINNNPTVLTIGPINVSAKPEANFISIPISPVCLNETISFFNTTKRGKSIHSGGCDSNYKFHWKISPANKVVQTKGILGSSNGFIDSNFNFNNWTNGSDSLELRFDSVGTFQIWLYAANACGIDSILQTIEVKNRAYIIYSPDSQTICSGDSSMIIRLTSSIPGYNIYWSVIDSLHTSAIPIHSGFGLSPVSIPKMILRNPSDSIGYIKLAANVGCSFDTNTTRTIFIHPNANVFANPMISTICSGDTTQIGLTSNLAGTTFSWQVISPISITGASDGAASVIRQKLVNNGISVDTVIYIVRPLNANCPWPQLEVKVIVLPRLIMNANPDIVICSGQEVKPQSYVTNIPNPMITWINSNPNIGLPSNGNGNLPNWIAAMNHSNLPVTATIIVSASVNGCKSTMDTFTITIRPNPQFTYVTNPPKGLDCNTNRANIIVTSNPNNCDVLWTGPFILSGANTKNLEIGGPGKYYITLTDNVTGCSKRDSINILPPVLLNITRFAKINVSCYKGTDGRISIETDNNNDSLIYSWSPNVASGPIASGLSIGNYQVKVTNQLGCSDSLSVILSQPDSITILLIDTNFSECGESNGSITVDAMGGAGEYRYKWSDGTIGNSLINVDAGTYRVTVTDKNYCSEKSDFTLNCVVLIPPVVPEFISPNNDQMNDYWVIKNLEYYKDNKVEIFNRWGNKVYSAEPYQNNWNGHYYSGDTDNGILPAGTYFYLLDTKKKSQKIFKGFIEIQP